jgi:hypothetical protein
MSGNIHKVDFENQKLPKEIKNYPNQDWILAGIGILREHGIRGISIEAISLVLNRNINDFNQEFNGLESYCFALLDFWYERETLYYIDIVDDASGNAEDALLTLIEIIHYSDKQDEIAIRNWALRCPHAHSALARVDRTRIDFGIGLFKELGFSENESLTRAKILYTSHIGTEYTSISSSLEQKIATLNLLMHKH